MGGSHLSTIIPSHKKEECPFCVVCCTEGRTTWRRRGASFSLSTIYLTDKNNSFRRAAETWLDEVRAATPNTSDILFMESKAKTETEMESAWHSVAQVARMHGRSVIRGQIFPHASKGDIKDGLEFAKSYQDDGTITRGEIVKLEKLPWTTDGLLILSGCNSGLVGARGWAPSGVFAESQRVKTTGQAGFAYFSENKDSYIEIDQSKTKSSIVYLWPYKRRRNSSWFGDGHKIEGVTF